MTDQASNTELERWNGRFAAEEFLFGTRPNAFLAAQGRRLRPGMRALCVADGEGRNSVWLAAQGLEVTAFDFSPVGLAKARTLAERCGVKVDYHLSEVSHWKWDAQQYDVVAAIFVQFASPPERQHMFEGMQRALKSGGLLIAQGYRPEQIEYATGGPGVLENLYTAGILRTAFAGWEIEELVEYEDEISEGRGHKGRSALIGMVARKP